MLPFLHKYIAVSPPSTSKQHKKPHRNRGRRRSHPKPSITSSCDTLQSQYTEHNDRKYSELPSTAESKVIFIETNDDGETDSESKYDSNSNSIDLSSSPSKSTKSTKSWKSSKSMKPSKHRSKSTLKTNRIQCWTVSIASKHNDFSKLRSNVTTMGFGVCDATDNHAMNEIGNYGYGYCVTYCDDDQYQSYHTKLKSVDDILIAFNAKSNKLTLWQNGKRFNRTFQLYSSKIYAFGIKLYGDDYYIKILPNTGN